MNNRYEIAREFADAIRSDDIVKIILFGSVARGDDTEESDIDILIITTNSDELSDEINSAAVDIILEKDEFISPHVMSEEHFKKIRKSFIKNSAAFSCQV